MFINKVAGEVSSVLFQGAKKTLKTVSEYSPKCIQNETKKLENSLDALANYGKTQLVRKAIAKQIEHSAAKKIEAKEVVSIEDLMKKYN